ncbi:MAG: glycoside hydrolase [Actinobacteria bacterium]|nr:glycoside hydrolase [Actinomycetota bacterium]
MSRARIATAVAAVLVVVGVAIMVVRMVPDGLESDQPLEPAEARRLAEEAANRFFTDYVTDDGRVVRRDQGGDTVSEGQAYAMLLAVALDDADRFASVWDWTRENLQRDDGLLSFRWEGGAVVGEDAASDADLDAARALVLAADRFGEPRYRDDARRLAEGIVAHETVSVAGEPVLGPGPWATGAPPWWVNVSYLDPRGFATLAGAIGDPVWEGMRSSSYGLVDQATGGQRPSLPANWSRLDASVQLRPSGPPDDPQALPVYGFESVRVPIRFGADCDQRGRRLAGRMWPFLRDQVGDRLAPEYRLNGTPAAEGRHPVAFVAAAGAAHGAGERGGAGWLLERAEEVQGDQPSYYGAAWIALGRILLTTDLLDEC